MSKDNRAHAPKVCPICRHVFQGIGWTGIDAHWRAHHEKVRSYEDAWAIIRRDEGKS